MGSGYMDIKSEKKIAIIDCNNFYVSCERLFNPELKDKPTAVLSNNDGCFIARSNQVKEMGVKMGDPVFKTHENINNKIIKFSSNYALYGDISDRITNLLKRQVKHVEVYSIDESFLDLSDIPISDVENFIKDMKSSIERSTGIPVSIGVAPTKTLAKLCNKLAKQNLGTCSYWHIDKNDIEKLEVSDIWGIGRKWTKKLKKINVNTVSDFLKLQPVQIRKMFNVTGLRTWYELNEVICNPIQIDFKSPKIIQASRSFGSSQWNPIQIKNSIWTHLNSTHKRLVEQDMITYKVNVSLATNRFDDDYNTWQKTITLSQGTDDINEIWNEISIYFDEIPVRLWMKSSVSLLQLRKKKDKQIKLFDQIFEQQEIPIVKDKLWMTRREHLSPEYTTKWDEIPLVH